jgi:hypothetical protein
VIVIVQSFEWFPDAKLGSGAVPITNLHIANAGGLDRRARHRAIGAEYAAIARLWAQLSMAVGALVRDLAGRFRHMFTLASAALGARDSRLLNHSKIDLGSGANSSPFRCQHR